MGKKKVIVLTVCPSSKKCAICIGRMTHAAKFYGTRVVEEATTESLIKMQDVELPVST